MKDKFYMFIFCVFVLYVAYITLKRNKLLLNKVFWIHDTKTCLSINGQDTIEYGRLLFGVELKDLKLRYYTKVSY